MAPSFALLHANGEREWGVQLTCRFEKDAHYAYLDGTPPPLYLGLILGEMVHNLRSALDQLAWQLALSHVGEATLSDPRIGNLIVFPITAYRELDHARSTWLMRSGWLRSMGWRLLEKRPVDSGPRPAPGAVTPASPAAHPAVGHEDG